jgi:hypothetical protein
MRVETIIPERFCPRSVPCHHSSSLFGIIHEKDRVIQRQHMHQCCPRNPGVRDSLVALNGGERRLHSLSGTMALPPHRSGIGPKKRAKKTSDLETQRKKIMSRQIMRRRPSAESAWQRRILFGRRYFFIRQMTLQIIQPPVSLPGSG